ISQGKSQFRWRQGQFRPADELHPSANQPPDEGIDRARPLPCWQDNHKLFCFVDRQVLSWAETELPVSQIYASPIDDQGNIWFSAPQSLIRSRDGRVAQVYTERDGLPGKNPALVSGKQRPLQAISRDVAGSLWITDLDSMQSHLLSLQAPEGLDNNAAYADNEGNYWFGAYNNGLFRARKQTVTPYAKAQGLNVKEAYPLFETRDGSIWIGTIEDGLFRFQDGAFTRYAFAGAVTSLYEDRAGQLWINGSSRLVEGRIVRELWGESQPNPLPFYNQAMCEDRAGAYWLGSATGVARHLNGAMTYFTTKEGLAGNDTRVIIPEVGGDIADGLWIGSYGC